MADTCCWLIDDLFVPVLGLVDELSQATNADEAIEHFDCDKSRHWCQVGQTLGQTDIDQLPGQDLTEAVRTIASIYEGTKGQCNTFPDVAIYIFGRLETLKQAAQRGWTAAKRGGTIPEDSRPISELPEAMEITGDGQIRLADWAVASHGVLLDQILLGPRPGFGNRFPISDFDVIVVDGNTPSVCPKTDRPVDAEWLPEILEVFKRCGMVKSGQTIHWVGSQAKLENVCTCFRKDLKADAERRAEPAKATERTDKALNIDERRAAWIGKALMLRKANPNMTKAEIARKVDVHPGQLSPKRFPELAELEKMLRSDTIGGHLSKNSDSGVSDVQAVSPNQIDQGMQIEGSKYYREYCVECVQPMRVKQDQVGTHPRCDDCAG